MSGGISLFLIAVGAVLAFAVNYRVAQVDIAAIGWILMSAGSFGILIYLLFLATFAPFHRGGESTSIEVVEPRFPHTH
ncbi:MAG: hypothetical protein AMXMBFR80_23310 [Dehalococcoidia bacterium]|jgi:hypothetical protein